VLDKNNSFHLFLPASALQSTQVKGHFISIRGFNRFPITHTGEADRIRTKRASWGQHYDERDAEQRFLCDFTSLDGGAIRVTIWFDQPRMEADPFANG